MTGTAGRSSEVAIEAANSSPAAYLFVDDDGRILRYPLEAEHVRIGRDVGNDIWMDHPHVRPHTLLVFRRDAHHHLKVYDGAKVQLNGAPVVGIHRLYGGDRIGLADREFLYGRDDTPAEMALGLTVMNGAAVLHAHVLRRTVVQIGRHGPDLALDDPSVRDAHLVLECYGSESVFAWEPAKPGQPASTPERRRLSEGALLQVGIFMLRVHLLPADAHGLLLPTARPDKPRIPQGAPPPMDRSPGLRRDPGAHSPRQRAADSSPVQGGFMRSADARNAGTASAGTPPALPEAVPVTEIGSLQMIRAAHEARPQPPAVRIKPEVMAAAGGDVLPPWHDAPPPLPAPQQAQLHDQNTQVLDTDAIAGRLRDQPPPLRPPSSAGIAAPLTQVLDTSTGRGELVRAKRQAEASPRAVGRQDVRPPPLPGEADPSERHVRPVIVDRSRRTFDEAQTQHDKPKP